MIFDKFNKMSLWGLIYQLECHIKQKGSQGGSEVKGQDLEKPLNLTPAEKTLTVFSSEL